MTQELDGLAPGLSIDLNADLGEEAGDDEAMLGCVTSASISCGAHAGGPQTLRAVLRQALRRGVTAGAHPGYPDSANFGRTVLPMAESEIERMVAGQVADACAAAGETGSGIAFVKPHGALYNLAADVPEVAAAIARGVRTVDARLTLLGLAGSHLLTEGDRAGLSVAAEGFADRAYRPDGRLVPRGEAGAVLHDPEAVARRAVGMVVDGAVRAADGTRIAVAFDSLCLHGDTRGAVEMAHAIRAALTAAGVRIAPFTRSAP